MSTTTVRVPEEMLDDVRRVGALQGKAPGEMLAEAWGIYLERYRDEIANDFERAAELIRAGDSRALAEHLGRNRRARAEVAAETA